MNELSAEESVDKTIDAICEWIQKELSCEIDKETSMLPEMTKALAELVAANANQSHATNNYYNVSSDE